mgnify:CR=1 FL=1
MTAAQAAQLIQDGDTVGLMGGGGGLMEATHLFEAVQERFLTTHHPKNLTVMHALGIGDKKTKGMNCFAHEGLVKRVIGGHWVWSPAMQQLALDNKIEAYILPGGVSSQLMRETLATLSHTAAYLIENDQLDGLEQLTQHIAASPYLHDVVVYDANGVRMSWSEGSAPARLLYGPTQSEQLQAMVQSINKDQQLLGYIKLSLRQDAVHSSFDSLS